MRAARRRAGMVAMGLALAGCGPFQPAAELAVEPVALRLDYGRFEVVRLRWRPAAELPAGSSPIVFVHLLDANGDVVRTFDHRFPSEWRVGREVTYLLHLSQALLATPLPPGSYRLSVGLYDPDFGRWQLRTAGAQVDDAEYVVAAVEVPREIETAVRVRFSSGWQPPESGTDLQILARRWLAGEGTIRLEDLPGPVRLRLELRIPEPAALRARLELAAGAGGPAVGLTTSCDGGEATVSGTGAHAVELALAAAPDGACDVTLRPNFRLLLEDLAEAPALALEGLAWAPAGP